MNEISYAIDAHDRFARVAEGWDELLGEPMWSVVDGTEAQVLWRTLLERVRAARGEIRLEYRCDLPDLRRRFEVRLVPCDDGGVMFEHRLLAAEPREPVKLLERPAARAEDDAMLRMCSWCGRVTLDWGRWLDVEDAISELELFARDDLPQITHGICADCLGDLSPAA